MTSSISRCQYQKSVAVDLWGVVFSFLSSKELEDLEERVCKCWDTYIESTKQWETRFRALLNIPKDIDSKIYLKDGISYKEIYRLVTSHILGGKVYEAYIGKVDFVSPIPEEISLEKCCELDPCDRSKTIGENYVWMYCPSYIEVELSGFSLSGIDDPSNREAPMLIRNGTERRLLKVPVTINNIICLFQLPKKGNPSSCKFVYPDLWNRGRRGNKRMKAGWVCMRKDLIRQDHHHPYLRGVRGAELEERILFNFLEHVRSNFYPDNGQYAFTSTMLYEPQFGLHYTLCGNVNSSGLKIIHNMQSQHKVAVTLPDSNRYL